MRSSVVLGVLLALACGAALFNASDTYAAGPVISIGSSTDHTIIVPYRALRNSGEKLVLGPTASDVTIVVTNSSAFGVGQRLELQNEVVIITSINGSFVGVSRGQHGTTAASHPANTAIYADFSRFDIRVDGISDRATGVSLAQAVDTSLGESSGAILSAPVSPSDTQIMVSDASVLSGAFDGSVMEEVDATLDGVSYAASSNQLTFLGSTGRTVDCDGLGLAPNSVFIRCYTLGDTPSNGPSGNGRLATITLAVPQSSSVATLDLDDVVLSPINPTSVGGSGTADPPINVEEVLDGVVRVGSPAPAGPSLPDPTPGLVSVWLSPKTQTSLPSDPANTRTISVDIMVNNVPAPGTQTPVPPSTSTGHGLGGYEFRLTWDPAPEDITITSARPGYVDDAGQPWDRGIVLSGNIDASVTTVPVNDGLLLEPGWTALVDNEQMLITSVSANSIGVFRGYRGTAAATHSSGATVYAGPERITATRGATPIAHQSGAVIKANTRTLAVTNHAPLVGATRISIDAEKFRVTQTPALILKASSALLAQSVNESTTTIPIFGSIGAGAIIKIDSEYMVVTASASGNLTVVRGFWGSTPSSHNSSVVLQTFAVESNTVRVTRASVGTTATGHPSGAALMDPDGVGSYSASIQAAADSPTVFRNGRDTTWLASTGRSQSCLPVSVATLSATFDCSSTGTMAGPTGSGLLAYVDVTGTSVLVGALAKTVTFAAGVMADASGDSLGATTNTQGRLSVMKCPDVNGDRIANFPGDVINIAKATFLIIPQLPVHDINNDGLVNFPGDAIPAAKMVTLGQPVGLRCVPNP